MTREDIEKLNAVEPYCFESDKEELWYNIGLKNGLEIADEFPQSSWISVKDDLPCNHEELLENENCTKRVLVVLAWNENPTKKHIGIADMCNMIGLYNVKFHWRCDNYYTVTHWRRLPELPKE